MSNGNGIVHIHTTQPYLQFDAFWPVHNLQVEDLTKVDSEIHVESSTVRSGNFFIVVQDFDEEGTFGHIVSASKLGTRQGTYKN